MKWRARAFPGKADLPCRTRKALDSISGALPDRKTGSRFFGKCSGLAVLAAATLLSACASTRGPVSDATVKIGKPYQVGGRTYVPRDDRDYDETGMASWYGPGHHGLTTANGERFDMNAISAAHPTLPLPSYAEVTALKTGKTVLVRINDRGPFAQGRIIDLSRGAARALGVEKDGVVRVRVRRVYPSESRRAALRAGR